MRCKDMTKRSTSSETPGAETDVEDARSRHVNERDVETIERTHESGFSIRRKKLAAAVDAEQLGCSLYEIPPGKKSWPYHYHTANEEAMYVLEGTGTLRAREGTASLEPGDYLTFPVGDTYARRVINDSEETLRYLCFSTLIEPEISVFPDSGKIGAFAGAPSGQLTGDRVDECFKRSDATGYWTDEP